MEAISEPAWGLELTVAIHYVFNTPYDQVVWDVGHQAYGHKILTGRRESFHTNRFYGGISGFPKRSESPYDSFGVGHSSTSVPVALGMAAASRYLGLNEKQHVAIIGDGALTGGMAFEALNHAGVSDTNLLIILNDNCMSIGPNVGRAQDYLTSTSPLPHTYGEFKRQEVWNLLGKLSNFGKNAQEIVSKIENGIKSTVLSQSNLFESLNLRYFGPVDGHDVDHLVSVLKDLRNIKVPKILHCKFTVKGKGYGPAEKGNATTWHSMTCSIRSQARSTKRLTRNHNHPNIRMCLATRWSSLLGRTIKVSVSHPRCHLVLP